MKKVLFLLTSIIGLLGSAQAQLASCPPGFTSGGGMTVAIVGSSTGVPFSLVALAATPYNGFGVSCNLASTNNGSNTNVNGNATVTLTGGTPGSGYSYTLTGGNGPFTATTTATSNQFTGLLGTTAGTAYTATATDANGCVAAVLTTNANVTSVTAPTSLLAGTCMTADLCQTNNAQVQVSAAGGVSSVSGYDVAWSVSTTTLVSPVVPATGLSGGNPSPALNAITSSGGAVLITGLSGNTSYHFVVTDDNGCVVQ